MNNVTKRRLIWNALSLVLTLGTHTLELSAFLVHWLCSVAFATLYIYLMLWKFHVFMSDTHFSVEKTSSGYAENKYNNLLCMSVTWHSPIHSVLHMVLHTSQWKRKSNFTVMVPLHVWHLPRGKYFCHAKRNNFTGVFCLKIYIIMTNIRCQFV